MIGVLLFAIGYPVVAHAAITYDTIAFSGDAAPDTGPGVTFKEFEYGVLNEVGQTVFFGYLTGTNVDNTNNLGIFIESGGTLELVARRGGAAPDTGSGVLFSGFKKPLLNNRGRTAFKSFLAGTVMDDINNEGIYSESGGTLGLVARQGDAAPGTGPGVNIHDINGLALNDAGQIAFDSLLIGTGVDSTNDRGIFSESAGVLGLVARTGTAAPGTGPGVNFSFFGNPVLNNMSQTAFFGRLTGTGVDSTNDLGIFSESSGTLELVARTGGAAPGTEPGVNFNRFLSPKLNDAGQTAFNGFLTGIGVDSTNDEGIFSESTGTLGLVARAGDAAPGTEPGVNFLGFTRPVLNDAGQTTFIGYLTQKDENGFNIDGIFSEFGGALGLVALNGDAAPDTGPSVKFRAFHSFVMNDAGQTAIFAFLKGTGVHGGNDQAIFATDPSGVLQLIAREGDLFDVNPDPLIVDNRKIRLIELTDGFVGSSNQLAFWLVFTDDSQGIFIANVPEPASLLLLALGGISCLSRYRN